MSKRDKETTIGGSKSGFQTTRWSEIRNAKTHDEARRRLIVGNLMKRYWKPVYCYLRRKGFNNEHAKDLTQGFFHEIVLGRELIKQADQTKGRFRTFLLTALDRYVISVHRTESAKKRIQMDSIVRLETIDLPNFSIAQSEVGPEQVFHYAWATNLLDQVLAEVKDECYSTRKATHWQVFHAKVVAPIVDSTQTPSLSAICKKYGVESESRASNMIVTVKRRFRAVLERCLRQYMQSDSDVEDEFNDLLEILSKSGAR